MMKLNCTFLLICILFYACKTNVNSSTQTKVVSRELTDPKSINPLNYFDENSSYVSKYTQARLIDLDIETEKILPYVANALPTVNTNKENQIEITFEIRKNATWDDGSPITAKDVAFTIKVGKNKYVQCGIKKEMFAHVLDIRLDSTNERKITIINKPYMSVVENWADINIIEKSKYDASNYMDSYTVNEIHQSSSKIDETNLKKFANEFNSTKYINEISYGAGPYKIVSWEQGKRLVLEKKKNWWGDAYAKEKNVNCVFRSTMPQVVFEVIKNNTNALINLKNGNIDVMRSIEPKEFIDDLQKNEPFKQKYTLSTPTFYVTEFIAMNNKHDILGDIRVRQALNYALDKKQILKTVYMNLANPCYSFIHPEVRDLVNDNINKYEINIPKSKALLAEAGWKDNDNDGILDKKIKGVTKKLHFTIIYGIGNSKRENICLLLREACKPLGISVEIVGKDPLVLLDDMHNHNFDAYVGGLGGSIIESDPIQLWHSSSITNGGNYIQYNNSKVDALIEKIRVEAIRSKRIPYYMELQKVIADDCPFIYIAAPLNRIATKKSLQIATSGVRPGYWLGNVQSK